MHGWARGYAARAATVRAAVHPALPLTRFPCPYLPRSLPLRLQNYGLGPYAGPIKKAEQDVKDILKRINDVCGIKESDTGLAPPSRWDLVSDKQMQQEEQPLQVARCTKIINPGTDEAKYVINVKQIAKFVVGLGDKVAPTDIEEGMRVGVDRTKYQIQIPLPPKIDPSVTMMTVEEKPDITYSDIGGSKEQIEKMREVVELPMLHPEKFVQLGIDPPKGVLMYGPPGTGKTLLARAVANRTDACFIRVIGSELVQKYVGEGARMVRELFQMARSKKACVVFFDEVDAIGGARFDDGAGGDNEVQRTMLEIVNQLDGFDARGNVKVLMATNRCVWVNGLGVYGSGQATMWRVVPAPRVWYAAAGVLVTDTHMVLRGAAGLAACGCHVLSGQRQPLPCMHCSVPARPPGMHCSALRL